MVGYLSLLEGFGLAFSIGIAAVGAGLCVLTRYYDGCWPWDHYRQH